MILLIDFDGTIVNHKFPDIGEPTPLAFYVLRKLKEQGHKLILWTCREGIYLSEAVQFCRDYGIEFDAINESIAESDWRYGTGYPMRKPDADMVIDDKNIGGFLGWHLVAKVFGIDLDERSESHE